MDRLTLDDLQVAGGVLCLAATLLAGAVSRWRLERDRTHFISEVLALPWWRPGWRARGEYGSAIASVLFALGALLFGIASACRLADGFSLAAATSLATSALLLGVVVFPLRAVPQDRIAEAGGLDLLHPFVAAVFYLAALINALVSTWARAGKLGMVLVIGHVVSSAALTTAVLVLAPRALGPSAWRPWFLPGVRILLDRRPPSESPTDIVRRLQWPCTVLIALDVALTPTGW